MEQMKQLKDLKMELGMNFDFIKNLNSLKGQKQPHIADMVA